jgi:hypothetical protein
VAATAPAAWTSSTPLDLDAVVLTHGDGLVAPWAWIAGTARTDNGRIADLMETGLHS